MAAFRIGARHRVPRAFWLWNLQHGAAHFTLNFDELRACGFWRISQGTTNVGRPSERVGVLVRSRVHFRLLQGQSHLSLALAFLLAGGFCSHGTQGFAGH